MSCVQDLPVEAKWGGIQPVSLDGQAIIGAVTDGLYVCTGLGPTGFMRGGMAGTLLAELMLGSDVAAQLLAEADPQRFANVE